MLAGFSGLWFANAATAPVIPPATKGEQCVADTALMRTDHMDLLNHQRDDTVIDGVRGEPFSLVECVNCHAQTAADGTPVRIDAEGQFCESCHAYAAVKIDCFTCHAAKPDQTEVIGQLIIEPEFDFRNNQLLTAWAASDHTNKIHEEVQREPFSQHLDELDNFSISANAYTAERDGRQSKARQ